MVRGEYRTPEAEFGPCGALIPASSRFLSAVRPKQPAQYSESTSKWQTARSEAARAHVLLPRVFSEVLARQAWNRSRM